MTSARYARIFVVGYQHSGTTLLQYILGRHSDIYTSYFETKFFEHLQMTRARFPDLGTRSSLEGYTRFLVDLLFKGYAIKNGYTLGGEVSKRTPDVTGAQVRALVDEFHGKADYVTVFCAVHDLVARTRGKTRWVEKTPTHVFYVDDIVASVPDAVFVEIVRDPRDILASKKTRRSRASQESVSGDPGRQIRSLALAYDPILDTLSWKSAIRAGRTAAERYPDRHFRLRYEDLLTQPEAEVRRVCGALDLKFEDDMLQVSGRGGAEWDKHLNKRGVDPTRTGRWRQVLSPREVAACQAVGGAEMVSLGYELVAVKPTARLGQAFSWLRSGIGLVRRLTRKWRLGGPAYFLNVVSNWRQRWRALHTR